MATGVLSSHAPCATGLLACVCTPVHRWRAAARALRLGFNVFLSDSDIVMFDDPYRYFKVLACVLFMAGMRFLLSIYSMFSSTLQGVGMWAGRVGGLQGCTVC